MNARASCFKFCSCGCVRFAAGKKRILRLQHTTTIMIRSLAALRTRKSLIYKSRHTPCLFVDYWIVMATTAAGRPKHTARGRKKFARNPHSEHGTSAAGAAHRSVLAAYINGRTETTKKRGKGLAVVGALQSTISFYFLLILC